MTKDKQGKNPYRVNGTFYNILEFAKNKEYVTRAELAEHGFPIHDVTTVLTPRLEGQGKGDIRGSVSAKGHVYYFKRLKKERRGDSQRFVFGYRDEVLEPLKRIPKKVIESQKHKIYEDKQDLVEV